MKSKKITTLTTAILFSICALPLPAQLMLNNPSFFTPFFFTTLPEYNEWEYSHWDRFYTPDDSNGTVAENRNYPEINAPAGYIVRFVGSDTQGPLGDVEETSPGSGVFEYVGPFNGEYEWDEQSYMDAAAAPYNFPNPEPTNSPLANPRTIYHPDNPTIRQLTPGLVITGSGFGGNFYSPFVVASYVLDDSVDYDAGTVVFQFQTQGNITDYNSIKLRYDDNGTMVELSPDDRIIEREGFVSHFGFTFTTRVGVQWNVSGLGIRTYEIVWDAAGTSSSFQAATLHTADGYFQDDGIPSQRTFTANNGTLWTDDLNWLDVQSNQLQPASGANITIQGGSSIDLGGATRHTSLLGFDVTGNFSVTNGTLQIGTGLEVADATSAQQVDINVPIQMLAHNDFSVGANATLVTNQPISGSTGVLKTGSGTMSLAGNNTFTGALYSAGGTINVSGTNTYGQTGVFAVDKTYILGSTVELEPSGVLGGPGVAVVLVGPSSTTIDSRLVVKGQRTFDRPFEVLSGNNPKTLVFTNTGSGTTCPGILELENELDGGGFGITPEAGTWGIETPLVTDQVTFSGAMSGGTQITGDPSPHEFRKTGLGTLIFSGDDKSYEHMTSVEAGTLELQAGTDIT
ncbi:MAG: autotransporter-associated beta strand repeat-containing protein, partial [Verrucomicrobiota bacterium]